MTEGQKENIQELRENGYGYGTIAQMLGMKIETVKSYCRRSGLSGNRRELLIYSKGFIFKSCLQCGTGVKQNPGRKEKKFCSDKCRMDWWSKNKDAVQKKAIYEYTCQACGISFAAYGNSHRKYCSHECYISARYGVHESVIENAVVTR